MTDVQEPDGAEPKLSMSDGLEERGQGAGRLLGQGAEQAIAGEDTDADDPDADQIPDGSGSSDHQADES